MREGGTRNKCTDSRENMRLKKRQTQHLYAQAFGQRGGVEIYRGRPQVLSRRRQRGGFFNIKGLVKLGARVVKSVVPKVSKKLLKEVGPDVFQEVLKQGVAIASGKKTLKGALKESAKSQAKSILKKSKNIIEKEVKQKLKGGRRSSQKGGQRKKGAKQKGGTAKQKGGIRKHGEQKKKYKKIKQARDIFGSL